MIQNSKYFKSNQEVWKETLQKLIKFIDNNKKTPPNHSKDKDEKILATWICTQKQVTRKNRYYER